MRTKTKVNKNSSLEDRQKEYERLAKLIRENNPEPVKCEKILKKLVKSLRV